jgi:antitoxin component of MazEF toxin-antitoxin module
MNCMLKPLTKTGNSLSLCITKEMREHLGVTDQVEVEFRKGSIVLKKPMTVQEAAAHTRKRYDQALRNLAK